ncbi:MAG: BatD family protein [Candidatus Omnitrophica bacterium]|nr:BatD family protein [Candidatus Omnitrophota bacterium]
MIGKMRIIAVALFFLAFGAGLAGAADIPLAVVLSRTEARVGDVVHLELKFENVQNIPAPELPDIPGCRLQYVGPSRMMSIVNGQASSSLTHRYALIPLKTGTYTIGPFSIPAGKDRFFAPAQQLQVADAGQPLPSPPPGGSAQRFSAENEPVTGEMSERLFAVLSVPQREGYYVQENIPVTLKLMFSGLNVINVAPPELEADGFAKENFSSRPKQYQESSGGRVYSVVEFSAAVYPTREGNLTLGPAKLTCTLAERQRTKRRSRGSLFDDMFDDSIFESLLGGLQQYALEVSAEAVSVPVIPFPAAGKPSGFNGAIGRFTFFAQASPLQVRAGDPVTLTMEIGGSGSWESVKPPEIAAIPGLKTYQPQVRQQDSKKIFEQVLIPESPDIQEVPALVFSFFDPALKQYVTLRQGPFPLVVSPGAVATVAQIIEAQPEAAAAGRRRGTQVIGRDIVYIKEQWRPAVPLLRLNAGFVAVHGMPLAGLGVMLWVRRRRRRLQNDVRYAQKLRAPKVARAGLQAARQHARAEEVGAFYDRVFKTLQEYIGHRFHRPTVGISAEIVDVLRAEGEIDEAPAEFLRQCFSDCDSARYAASQFDQEKMRLTLTRLEQAIDYLERKKK